MRIEKKVWPEYFQQIVDGKKTFELRLNDFDISEGDTLVLDEWDPTTKDFTGRTLEKQVGYVGKWKIDDLTKFWPRQDVDDKCGLCLSSKRPRYPAPCRVANERQDPSNCRYQWPEIKAISQLTFGKSGYE